MHTSAAAINDNKSCMVFVPPSGIDLATTADNKQLIEELKVFDCDYDEPLLVEVPKHFCSDSLDAYHEELHLDRDWVFEAVDEGIFVGLGELENSGHDDGTKCSAPDAHVTTPLPTNDSHQHCLRTPTQTRKPAPKRSCDDTRRLVRRKSRKRARERATTVQFTLSDKFDTAIETAICSRRKSKWTQPEQAFKLRVSVV